MFKISTPPDKPKVTKSERLMQAMELVGAHAKTGLFLTRSTGCVALVTPSTSGKNSFFFAMLRYGSEKDVYTFADVSSAEDIADTIVRGNWWRADVTLVLE